jgi:hypothetical protein
LALEHAHPSPFVWYFFLLSCARSLCLCHLLALSRPRAPHPPPPFFRARSLPVSLSPFQSLSCTVIVAVPMCLPCSVLHAEGRAGRHPQLRARAHEGQVRGAMPVHTVHAAVRVTFLLTCACTRDCACVSGASRSSCGSEETSLSTPLRRDSSRGSSGVYDDAVSVGLGTGQRVSSCLPG